MSADAAGSGKAFADVRYRPGLRITHYKGRAIIAFAVEAELVSIIGVFYGGQDYEGALRSLSDD